MRPGCDNFLNKIMKKSLLALAMVLTTLMAGAADYGYLIIRQADGSETTLNSVGLTFKVNDGQLSVTTTEGTKSFTLASLESMAYAKEPAAAEIINTDNAPVEVFTTDGLSIGTYESVTEAIGLLELPGVYIFNCKGITTKIKINK